MKNTSSGLSRAAAVLWAAVLSEWLRIGDRHETNYLARPYAQGELISNSIKEIE